ncbi:hypothetical protein ACHWQZ_G010951 [Mnemiopsis leidyi]
MEKLLKPDKLDAAPGSTLQWIYFKQTFDNFVDSFTTALTGAQKLAALVNCVSPGVYSYISAATSYEAAIAILKDTYESPKNEVYARHVLSTRKQKDGETVDEFMHQLDVLSKDCTFTDVDKVAYRDEYVRDAFIRGLYSPEIRQRLLEECANRTDTFKKARTLELALKNNLQMQDKSFSCLAVEPDRQDVNEQNYTFCAAAVSNPQFKERQKTHNACYFCGNRYHPRSDCPARELTCHLCGKKGHFGKVCKSGKRCNRPNTNPSQDYQRSAAMYPPYSLSDSVVNVKVNNSPITALIDSGSSNSFIDHVTVSKLGLTVNNSNSQSIIMASNSCSSNTLGTVKATVLVAGHTYNDICLQVMENLCCDMIIGHDILKRHEKLVINFGGSDPPLVIDNLSNSAFACKLSAAKIPPQRLFEFISLDAKPIACKSRRFSSSDKQFIDMEIHHLLSEGIIEPSTSPWRAQVLVVNNESSIHRRRLVVDYSRTINKYTMLDAYPLPNLDELAHKVAQFSIYSSYDLKSAYHQVPLHELDKIYTAFEASGRLYQFTRIPFGVTNGVAAFQRFMDSVIDSEKTEGIFAYLDNITIGGIDQADHDSKVERFEQIVSKYGLTLNHSKTISSVKEIGMLGYLISKGQIKPDPARMKPLLDLPTPCDHASLKRVLGLFSYYSKWVPQYSDKIRPLISSDSFPLSKTAVEAFELVKKCIHESCIVSPNDKDLLVVETDASGYALSASLNQNSKPVAFFSRTLNQHEKLHSAVEKEACAIVEAVRKWRHYLSGRKFLLVTDQQAVSFLFSKRNVRGTAKNEKIARWRVELSCFDFEIKYRPGTANLAADCLSRAYCAAMSHPDALSELHIDLCHPGIVRMLHYIRTHNYPYSVEDVKRVISNCRVCAEIKPTFFKPQNPPLVKATKPFERLSIDFKGPLPSVSKNKYILTVIDEYSRFPFAFPCSDMHASTVKNCLIDLFSLFGEADFIHSDRGQQFMSDTVKSFLLKHGIGSSHSSRYNPRGNGQTERYNGIIWQSVRLALRSQGLQTAQWEAVLPKALHSIRSLLCTSTNQTPHERLFNYTRKSSYTDTSHLPNWLTEKGKVLLKRHVRSSKYEDLCDEVELLETNPTYARVKLANGVDKTVSLRDLAPLPRSQPKEPAGSQSDTCVFPPKPVPSIDLRYPVALGTDDPSFSDSTVTTLGPKHPVVVNPPTPTLRKSQRLADPPDRLNYDKLGGP